MGGSKHRYNNTGKTTLWLIAALSVTFVSIVCSGINCKELQKSRQELEWLDHHSKNSPGLWGLALQLIWFSRQEILGEWKDQRTTQTVHRPDNKGTYFFGELMRWHLPRTLCNRYLFSKNTLKELDFLKINFSLISTFLRKGLEWNTFMA